MRDLIIKLVSQSKQATSNQLAKIVAQASLAPFVTDLLVVDAALWGGFWQGDVIAPNSRLPGIELALLRATRLEATWPEDTTATEFLADLRAAILDPQAGVWMMVAAGEPCVIFASRGEQGAEDGDRRSATGGPTGRLRTRRSVTVVWYCATTGRLHAGYRTAIDRLRFEGSVEQRRLKGSGPFSPISQQSTLAPEQSLHQDDSSSGQRSEVGGQDLTARLDADILRFRHQGA